MSGPGWSVGWRRRFRAAMLCWYRENGRDLPWRRDRDPYRVWISEIMLQQTRVAAVVPYYARFLRRFPTVQRLARARVASVLAAWSGLGYYQRARRLHAAAGVIVRQRGGRFPTRCEEWCALPGVGRYTAAAISSIAFAEPQAVVDGNVERVISRLAGEKVGRRETWDIAGQLLDRSHPGDFNQAMMELGAEVCLPRRPKCEACPVRKFCATQGSGVATDKEQRRRRDQACVVALRGGKVALVQRPPGAALMPGLWELPELAAPNGARPWFTVRHSITQTDYRVAVYRATYPPSDGRWVSLDALDRLPITGLTRKVLRHAHTLI